MIRRSFAAALEPSLKPNKRQVAFLREDRDRAVREAEQLRRALRDAADEAAAEVLWHLEHEGSAPAHMLARAEELMRAVGALADEPAPPRPAAARD